MAADPFVTPANNAAYGETLMEPITLQNIRNVTELDEKRRSLLEEAKHIAMLQEKLDRQMAEADKHLAGAKELATEYKKLITQQANPRQAALNDPKLGKKLDFTLAAKPDGRPIVIKGYYNDRHGRQVFATPIENVAIAKDILVKDHSS